MKIALNWASRRVATIRRVWNTDEPHQTNEPLTSYSSFSLNWHLVVCVFLSLSSIFPTVRYAWTYKFEDAKSFYWNLLECRDEINCCNKVEDNAKFCSAQMTQQCIKMNVKNQMSCKLSMRIFFRQCPLLMLLLLSLFSLSLLVEALERIYKFSNICIVVSAFIRWIYLIFSVVDWVDESMHKCTTFNSTQTINYRLLNEAQK